MNKKQGWIGDPEIKDIRTTKSESETRLTKMQKILPGIVGYGITKNSPEKISVLAEKITPEIRSMFRKGIRGQEVCFIEVGHIVALSDRKTEYRPLIGGISVGHYLVSAGTIGSIVYDKDTNQPLILSNCHVIANSDTSTEEYALPGDAIHQPGLYDDPNAEICSKLHNWIPLENGVTVDAATAIPIVDISNTILDIPRITGTTSPEVGTRVKKSGRTTGYTEGEIISVESTIDVDYGFTVIRLTDQFITTCMSAGGDSGSIGKTNDGKVVGLLFAGSDKVTIYNDINNVTELLNIKFVKYDTGETDITIPVSWPSTNDAIMIAAILVMLGIAQSCLK